jgi:uncharacterized protein YigE (DUF2233 family)
MMRSKNEEIVPSFFKQGPEFYFVTVEGIDLEGDIYFVSTKTVDFYQVKKYFLLK